MTGIEHRREFEAAVEMAKFDSQNDDDDGLPMIEVPLDVLTAIFKDSIDFEEVPYFIYKDVKVYVEGKYEETKKKEKTRLTAYKSSITSIPLDSTIIHVDGVGTDFYEGN